MKDEHKLYDSDKPNHKNTRQMKVLLDDEFNGLLEYAAMIHRTKKGTLAREVLKSWLLSVVEDHSRDRRSNKANQ
ncbi:hypothetical protein [Pseudomonas fluorescens]|uniref:hypothetical protein n=1 Tax=Pseudomonas fluorescens TaxID=294 RepID=UPI003D210650